MPQEAFEIRRRSSAPIHWAWWPASVVVLVIIIAVGQVIVANPNMEWYTVWAYFGSEGVIRGLFKTLELTLIAMAMGLIGGVLLAVGYSSRVPIVSWGCKTYVWLFRGTPLLVQIIFWYNIAALLPTVGIGLPGGPMLVEVSTNVIVTPWLAAVLALGLNEAAYMAEIVRAGFLAIDAGQTEAAYALGMTRGRALTMVVIPQALRVIIPPTGNQIISMLKASSLVSVISAPELLYSVQIIYNQNFRTIPLLVVACIWYLIVTTVLYTVQYYIERRLARGEKKSLPPTPLQKLAQSARRLARWVAPEQAAAQEARS